MSLKKLRIRDLWSYASGEGASSITMNGISGFAMLFYTQIMGMSPELVGIAFAVGTIYDAITDPLMGTVSDRTRSRFGRRHPYMLLGGVTMTVFFFLHWFVPESFQGEQRLFAYLIVINLLIKTAFTVFVVPFTALGFEMCVTDEDRARIQGVRFGFNMIMNVLFTGLGWILFFPDGVAEDGSMVDGTKIVENFHRMGMVLSGSAVLLVCICVATTFRFANKSEQAIEDATMRDHFNAFIHDLKDVYSDKFVWFVFGFFGLAQFAMMVVSQVQMFTYVEYMRFSSLEKTVVHTGGMFGFMAGSFLLGSLVQRLDKKKTGYCAMAIAASGCIALLAIFSGGLMDPQAYMLFTDYQGQAFHLSALVFGVLQSLWWGGCGILVPLAVAMIADLSAIKKCKTGEVTEGRYAAGLSFFLKASSALGMLVTGYILKGVGYISGAEMQSPETLERLALMTFIVGPLLMILSYFVLRKYPITHKMLNELSVYPNRSNC